MTQQRQRAKTERRYTRKVKRKFSYYNYDKLYSNNCTYNSVVGGRGLGKTYGAKKKVIKKAIDRGEMFIYLRRYKPEIIAAKQTFFADVAHEFPEWEFRVNGNLAQMATIDSAGDKKRAWQTIGYFIELSRAQAYKSVSFELVTTIIFDEFIIEKGNVQYLPSEVDVLNNFYSTVDRYQGKTVLLMLANSVSIMNPYFHAWDIDPAKGEWQMRNRLKSGRFFLAVHFPDAAKFASEVKETDFGQFIAGTDYEAYAVDNQFNDAHDAMIGEKPSTAVYEYTLETKKLTFSIWWDMRTRMQYVQTKLPKTQRTFVLDPNKMGEGKRLMRYGDDPLQRLRHAMEDGMIRFDHPSTRNAFIEISKR